MDIQRKCSRRWGHTRIQWLFALLANGTFIVYGLDCGWISPISTILKSEESPVGYPLTDDDIAWIASTMSMAAVFGVYMYSIIADKYGRKTCIIIIAIFEAMSWIIRASYTSFATLIIARACIGIAAAGCFGTVPMYVKEISQDDLRGILGTLPILLQNIGIFVMYVIGAYLDYKIVTYIVVIIPIITILVMIKAPESPAFLINQDKIDEATETVAFLRGLDKDDSVVQGLIETMTKEEAYFKTLPNITLKSILKNKAWRRGFILIMLTFTLFEFNGAYTIMTYASQVLSSTGVQFEISPEIQSLSFPVVMMSGTIALSTCIERFGRKPLLIGAFLVSSVAMFGIAIMIFLQKEIGVNVPSWLPLVVMMLAVSLYSGGVCPLPYIMMTEMFNYRIRAKVMGVVVTYGWFLTFVTLRMYAPVVNMFGEFAPFVFYGTINLLGAIFTIIWLTETKGKSEEEVLQCLMKNKKNST